MARDHNYFVHSVECNDGLYNSGVTNDLDRRLAEHNEGIDPKSFTFKRRPVVLRYWDRRSDVKQALSGEKQLKGWGRKRNKHCLRETGIRSSS